ncbi:MAG TPA: hypothetical protein DCE28_05660 [Halomonas sp.]|nr:hypothetical protein [Halomonas sp.]
MSSLETSLPLTGERLALLSDAEVQSLDQFVLRFGKLQDAIGARLMPSVLLYLQEPYEDRPMLDKLHRLEKLGYIEDSEQWQALRMLRNRFAHEYPDDPDKNAAILMLAIESVASLEAILKRIDQKLALSSIS